MNITEIVNINEIRTRFEAILPDIIGRIRSYQRRFLSDPEEAAAEMMALSWTGFRSKALRTGVFLTPGQIVFMSYRRVADCRVAATGFSSTDPLAPYAFKRGRVRRIFLSEMSASKKCQALPDSTVQRIVDALSHLGGSAPVNSPPTASTGGHSRKAFRTIDCGSSCACCHRATAKATAPEHFQSAPGESLSFCMCSPMN